MNMAGGCIGTNGYQAPEIFENQLYDIRADIWSLGVVLYKLAFNHDPFDENSYRAQVTKDKYTIPNARVDIPQGYFDLIIGCLKYNPDDRISINKICEQL